MVPGAKIDGTLHILSAGVRKTIQQIKEIVGNHSDADIYVALKETNMDPNETAQKLLNQDPFHEVKRKRDKKKESVGSRTSTSSAEPRKNFDHVAPVTRTGSHPDCNVRKTSIIHSTLPDAGFSQEFRVVRDNRINNSSNNKSNSVQSSDPVNEPEVHNANVKSRIPGTCMNEKLTYGHMEQTLNGRSPRVRNTNVAAKKEELREEMQQSVVNTAPTTGSSTNSVIIGVYSSSSDPIHVPSPDSRPAAAKIGAIKREIRQNPENSKLSSSSPRKNISNSHFARDGTSSLRPSNQNIMPESTALNHSVNRSFANNQHNGRSHQLTGHKKAAPNKVWKPKSSQKLGAANGPGVIGMPVAKTSSPMDNTKVGTEEVAQVIKDQLSQVHISENQNVIIASHIRVSEIDRSRLTFGSLGGTCAAENTTFIFQASGNSNEPYSVASEGLLVSSSPEPSLKPGNDVIELDDNVQNSGFGSPETVSASENRITEKVNEVSTPEKVENYADLRIVRASSPSYVSPVAQQQEEDTTELQTFSSYDPQTGYDMTYFRPVVDEHVRGQGLASLQEALISHGTNTIPSSSMEMLQAQAQAQMYQQHQLQVSPYNNMMPYRQFISPLYVPPMPMPGYSGNAAPYPHPLNGNSYVLMAGNSSHLNSSGGAKYAIQQFKPLQSGSPSVFGNPAGLEDSSSRLKYKDVNLYFPTPQAETSEIWMNTRDIRSGSYYNVPGHPAYLSAAAAAHNNHSFNAAVAQSTQMPMPTFYHPSQQPPGMAANPHHFGPTIGGNVAAAAAAAAALTPGAQVGSYQQPQIGHQNWTGNF